MNWRPDRWKNPYKHYELPLGRPIKDVICEEECNVGNCAYEAGADAILKAIMKARPSDSEIRIRIIEALYGGTSVPEFERWLKERLLLKP